MTDQHKKPGRRPVPKSYFWPILLIVVGAVFLLDNLGVIPGDGWSTVFRMWPALLIIAGLDDLIRREGVVWPVLLIGAGTFLLLNNFGPSGWISWTKLVQLWPVLLIAVGIDLIFKADTGWSSAVGILLAVILIGGLVWWVGVQGLETSSRIQQISQRLEEGIETAAIDLELAGGQIVVGEIQDQDVLIGGEISPDVFQDRYQQVGEEAEYQLKNDQVAVYPFTAEWELGISGLLPLELTVDQGAGQVFLALEALRLEGLSVEQGAGELVVRLPEEGSGLVQIDQAVGRIRVVLPEGAGVKIRSERALSVMEVPGDYVRSGSDAASPGLDGQAPRYTITVEQAVGLVEFQYAR